MEDVIFTLVIGAIIGVIIFCFLPSFSTLHGPNSKDIKKNIYKHKGKYYRLKPVITICPSYISMSDKNVKM